MSGLEMWEDLAVVGAVMGSIIAAYLSLRRLK